MNNITLKYLACCFLFICLLSNCAPSWEEAIKELNTSVNIDPKYGTTNQIHGYPFIINILIKSSNQIVNVDNLYLHVFHKVEGDNYYYYQDSSPVILNDLLYLRFWGGKPTDINKMYDIYLIMNNRDKYQKDKSGVYKIEKLPKVFIKKFSVFRVE